MGNKLKASDYIADYLVSKGMSTCFTVTGGGAMHLNDSFGHHNSIESIYNHHEQASAMAAEGYARAAGKPALVCVTSGPGATNAITGVLGAWLDSIPMFVISGQMKYETTIKSTSIPLRQLGFQEFNIVDSVQCMTKYVAMVTDSKYLAYHLEAAFYHMNNGRKGPVWLDIPLDIQGVYVDVDEMIHFDLGDGDFERVYIKKVNPTLIEYIFQKINASKKPVIIAGNGVRLADADKDFIRAVEKLKIPIVTEWNAHDLIWDDHQNYCGRPGSIGNRGGNFVVQNCDLLISLGCQLSIRQISYEWKNFAPNAFKIAIDIDKSELIKPTLNIDYPICADVKDILVAINQSTYQSIHAIDSAWHSWCRAINKKYPVVLDSYYVSNSPVNLYVFMKKLSDQLKSGDIIVVSNGAACVTGLQTIEMKECQRMFTNAGASSMGYGLAAAIGAGISNRNNHIICLEGDGSIQMNLQELQTIVHLKLPIKIFLINNRGYHSIRQTQTSIFNAAERGLCGADEDSGISFPDASKIAQAYGIAYKKIESLADADSAITEVYDAKTPVICEIIVDPNQDFQPKLQSKALPDGKFFTPSLEDMFPFLSNDEMKANIF